MGVLQGYSTRGVFQLFYKYYYKDNVREIVQVVVVVICYDCVHAFVYSLLFDPLPD